jgi:hypothetical protein
MSKNVEKISIHGEWDLINQEKSIRIKAQVPGTVFEALIEKNLIEDPFYGENEHGFMNLTGFMRSHLMLSKKFWIIRR